MLQKIKMALGNNDMLFALTKCIKNLNNKKFVNLLRSYFQLSYEGSVYILEHPGTLFPDNTIYDISTGEYGEKSAGFCAEVHHLLYKLMIADEHALLPRVTWGSGSPYYEPELNMETNNAFEYYFEPISEASKYSCDEFKNLIRSNVKHILKFQNMITGSYFPNEGNIHLLAESFKKHMHLNETTQKFISESIKSLFKGNEKILGVHARGGDFNREFVNHPQHVSAEEYLETVKTEFASGNYEKIFIATDDENILKIFVGFFGNNLVFYDDVHRVFDDRGVHERESGRPMHHYRLGLELLRDVYTLVSCDSFICGLSHVSFMVRYVKESFGEQFNKVIILDDGINKLAK